MDHDIQTVPPVVVLARPQMGENIGAAARAMKSGAERVQVQSKPAKSVVTHSGTRLGD